MKEALNAGAPENSADTHIEIRGRLRLEVGRTSER